jgi:beta-galactosidase
MSMLSVVRIVADISRARRNNSSSLEQTFSSRLTPFAAMIIPMTLGQFKLRFHLPKWLLWKALLCCVLSGQTVSAGERLTLNFNHDWKFLKADPPGAFQPAFNDQAWTPVSAPHTFNDIDTFDDFSVPNHIGETNQWSGRTWYRKAFTLPANLKGRKVYLEFEAVRQVAEVYLNGRSLGTNRTGFIPFGFDLTPLLRFGGATNILAVMADNRFTLETELTRIAATELPWNSPHWHPAHGGIYRNVYLHSTDPLHISLPLYSSLKTVGPYLYATDISEASATVHCEIPVQNGRPAAETVSARVEIFAHDGKSLLQLDADKPIAAGGHGLLKLSSALPGPQLWEPDYPYLYKAVCTLTAQGQIVDSCEIPFGIRYVRWDAKSGFYINGHHLKLHGWGQKPTNEWPGLGAAHPDWMHYYTLELMKEAGGNFVRWGHCAGAPADLASCDQLGLIVEQPGCDGEGDAQGDAWTLRAAAFRDMLVYYRNHPCIIIWEGGNQKVARDHVKQLRGHMDNLDPHGGRAYAQRRADETDGAFMDVDIGTEGGRQLPRLPVVEGEYDREESPRRVWDNFSPPNFGYPEAKGQTYQLTSEQYAVNEVAEYVTKIGKPYHCGGANWIFSDSTSGGRLACEVTRASGEVDGARLPKEAYYVCQAMFRADPQVHIIGHWTYPVGTKKTVYVASNGEEVELLVNGKSLGHGKVSDRYLFTFTDVTWEPGDVKAVAYRKGAVIASQTKHTVGAPVALRLTPMVGPKGFLADGSDVALMDVEVVDAKGERCPTFQQRVDFDLTGPGVWRGGYNSGKAHSINNTFLDVECGINRVAVRSTRTSGDITVVARCGNLKSAACTVTSLCVTDDFGCNPLLPPLPPPSALVKPAPQNAEILAGSESPPQTGRFLRTFSYSGPAGTVCVQQDAKDGAKIYADRDFVFSSLPLPLQGSDWVQTANADKLYSAADLMEIAAQVDGMVYVAHDDRLPCPDWLQREFKPTDFTLAINGQPMKIFERRIHSGESLTLGSNVEDRRLKSCNMYIVFVKRA